MDQGVAPSGVRGRLDGVSGAVFFDAHGEACEALQLRGGREFTEDLAILSRRGAGAKGGVASAHPACVVVALCKPKRCYWGGDSARRLLVSHFAVFFERGRGLRAGGDAECRRFLVAHSVHTERRAFEELQRNLQVPLVRTGGGKRASSRSNRSVGGRRGRRAVDRERDGLSRWRWGTWGAAAPCSLGGRREERDATGGDLSPPATGGGLSQHCGSQDGARADV